jgi:hypothetical protein
MLKRILTLLALCVSTAHAAEPMQMNAVYDLYRNGQKLGSVSDTFTRSGKHYRIDSVTRAEGPLKLLWPGTISMLSEGSIDADGLRPATFVHARSDKPKMTARASFDWEAHSVRLEYKGKTREQPDLAAHTQDQLSQLYQFVFMASLPSELTLDVASGKSINTYHYRRSDGGKLSVPAGEFAVQKFERVTGPGDDKAVTVWIATARNNFPVQVRVVDDDATLEQRLVRLSITP